MNWSQKILQPSILTAFTFGLFFSIGFVRAQTPHSGICLCNVDLGDKTLSVLKSYRLSPVEMALVVSLSETLNHRKIPNSLIRIFPSEDLCRKLFPLQCQIHCSDRFSVPIFHYVEKYMKSISVETLPEFLVLEGEWTCIPWQDDLRTKPIREFLPDKECFEKRPCPIEVGTVYNQVRVKWTPAVIDQVGMVSKEPISWLSKSDVQILGLSLAAGSVALYMALSKDLKLQFPRMVWAALPLALKNLAHGKAKSPSLQILNEHGIFLEKNKKNIQIWVRNENQKLSLKALAESKDYGEAVVEEKGKSTWCKITPLRSIFETTCTQTSP